MGLFETLFPPQRATVPAPELIEHDDGQLTHLAAAITQLHAPRSGKRIPQTEWQKKVIEFDRDGPGFVGFYLDLISYLVFMLTPEPQVNVDGVWVPDNSAQAVDALSELKGLNGEEPADLARMTARALCRTGESVWVPFDTDNSPFPLWRVVETALLEKLGPTDPETGLPESWVIKDTPAAKEGSEHWHRVPGERPWWVLVPDPDRPAEAWSPLRRVLRDIRGYNLLDRNLNRTFASRLVWNSILWVEGKYTDVKRKKADGSNESEWGPLGLALRDLIETGTTNLNDVDDNRVSAAMAVPFVSPNRPELVSAARPIDSSIFQAIEFRLAAIARGVNIPAHIFLEGPGTANRWNDVFLDESVKQTAVLPIGKQVYTAMTRVYWDHAMTRRKVDPTRRRLWFNAAAITQKLDNVEEIGEAVKQGVLLPEAWAAALGLEDMRMTPPAPGEPATPEYAHWERTVGLNRGGKGKDGDGTGVKLPTVASAEWWQ